MQVRIEEKGIIKAEEENVLGTLKQIKTQKKYKRLSNI